MPDQPVSSTSAASKQTGFGMLESLLAPIRKLVDSVFPSPETLAQREAAALQSDCCDLLMEVARLGNEKIEQHRKVVAQVMQEQFALPDEAVANLIENASRPENQLTSYYPQIARINKRFAQQRKAKFVEQLWRVAMVDGNIDMYEDHLVRKLSDLLYVPHADFILAKNRVRSGHDASADGA